MRNSDIAAHLDCPLVGHDAALLSRDLVDLGIRWGSEVYREGRWRRLTARFGGKLEFNEETEAIQAAVRAWRRTDRPARALALPAVPNPTFARGC